MILKRVSQTLFFACSVFIFCNCSCTDDGYCKYSGYLLCHSGSQTPKLLWSVQLSDEISGEQVYPGGDGFPYYDNIVAVGYGRGTNRETGFVGLDLNTGKKLWETPLSDELSANSPFMMLGKNVILPRSSHWFQLMDMTTGSILEDQITNGYYEADIQRIGNRLVYVGSVANSKGTYDDCFFQAFIDHPFGIEVLLPPNKRTDFVGDGSEFNIFIDRFRCKIFVGKGQYEGDTLLLFHQSDPMFDGAQVHLDYFRSINLYNITKKTWIYRHKEGPTILCIDEQNGRMYMSYWDSYNYRDRDNPRIHDKVYMYDLYTGEEIKVFAYASEYPPKTAIIWEDILLICQNSGNTVAMNKHNGQILWEKDFSGMNESIIQVLNGVLYFTAGRLVALDIRTGELLWNINTPRSFGYLQAIPGRNGEKGKIVAYDYLNAYCYEAVR